MNLETTTPPSFRTDAAAPLRRARRVVRLGVVAFTVFLLALLWGGLAVQLGHDRQQTLDNGWSRSAALSATFAEHLTSLMRALDQTTLGVKQDYEQDPTSFDAGRELTRYAVLRDFSLQISIVGPDGFVTASSLGEQRSRTYLGDREHFIVHQQSDGHAMFISKPVFGRLSNRWSIQLTRRLNDLNGEFAGVLVVSLDPEYLAGFFRTFEVGENGFVSVVGREDMVVRARTTGMDLAVRQTVGSTQLPRRLEDASSGTYEGPSPIDGVDRVISYHSLAEYPLVLVVGMSRSYLLGQFEERRTSLSFVALAISVVFVGVAALLLRQIDRQARAETALRQQTVALAESRQEAETASRAKSQFLANMSHELRTPLNAIIGFSEVMTKGVFGPIGSPRYMQYAADIHRSGQHLLELINGVLDMSRIEAGQQALSAEEVELAPLAEECLGYVSVRAEEGGVLLENGVGVERLRVRVDRRAFRQILLNLLSNAVKFTPRGGRVRIEARSEGKAIAISVLDTGVGIAASDLDRIFEPFQQAESTVARRREGTGLGLSITKNLVSLSGGSIAVASEIGKGTAITVRLPAAAPVEFRAAG
ncbi:MAG TPA: ATP-binding protein [Stellaceae bacterium]|nr:ATP-binding protein [Stellaceae bacterium]